MKKSNQKNSQISFSSLLSIVCPDSEAWLKRNRSKGLRWIIKMIFIHKSKWMLKHDAWNHVATIAGMFSNNESPAISSAASEIYEAFNRNTYESVLAVLNTYKINDEFSN